MTKVHFYHGVGDRLAAAVNLLGKAHAQGKNFVVYAPDAGTAQRLDQMLWAQPALGFVPHCKDDSPLARETPIVITGNPQTVAQDQRLLNLSDEVPPGFESFENLVEIVSSDGEDLHPARERYKRYRTQGYEIQSHELKNHE